MWRMLFITLIISFTMVLSVQGEETSELAEFADFVTDQHLEMDEWQVTMKEKVKEEMITEILVDLQGNYQENRTEDDNLVKFSFKDSQKENDLDVLYNVILPKDNFTYPELNVVIEGDSWSEELKANLHKEMHSISSKYFTDNKRVFSWLKTEGNDIIGDGAIIENLISHLDLEHVKTQKDHTSNVKRKYIYGFTDKWNEKINMNDTPINVQIAITSNKNGHPELTLGTPILITEY